MAIEVIPELERNLRALTETEFEELERNILADGCRDPIAVWQEGNAILDGHNRFKVCTKHEIPFETTPVSLPSLQAALAWQVRNQFGKRNLTPAEVAYLRGRDYLATKGEHGGSRAEASGQSDHLKSGEEVAKRHGVGERTVRRDAEYAEAVDVLADTLGDDTRTRILTGEGLEHPLSKQDVAALAHTIREEPGVGERAAALLAGEQPNDANGRNPHGIRDPATATQLGRIKKECGELTYLRLFEQVETTDTPLVRHDRTQLQYLLSLARKGEPDEEIALIVAGVGWRYRLKQSIAQLTYILSLADGGEVPDEEMADGGEVPDEEMADVVKTALKEGESIYRAVWDKYGQAWPRTGNKIVG